MNFSCVYVLAISATNDLSTIQIHWLVLAKLVGTSSFALENQGSKHLQNIFIFENSLWIMKMHTYRCVGEELSKP